MSNQFDKINKELPNYYNDFAKVSLDFVELVIGELENNPDKELVEELVSRFSINKKGELSEGEYKLNKMTKVGYNIKLKDMIKILEALDYRIVFKKKTL